MKNAFVLIYAGTQRYIKRWVGDRVLDCDIVIRVHGVKNNRLEGFRHLLVSNELVPVDNMGE